MSWLWSIISWVLGKLFGTNDAEKQREEIKNAGKVEAQRDTAVEQIREIETAGGVRDTVRADAGRGSAQRVLDTDDGFRRD